jgi:hypothetical protein
MVTRMVCVVGLPHLGSQPWVWSRMNFSLTRMVPGSIVTKSHEKCRWWEVLKNLLGLFMAFSLYEAEAFHQQNLQLPEEVQNRMAEKQQVLEPGSPISAPAAHMLHHLCLTAPCVRLRNSVQSYYVARQHQEWPLWRRVETIKWLVVWNIYYFP